MRSIKSKIFSIILSGIITSSFIVGSLGIFWANRTVRHDSVEILDLMAQVKADGLNKMFHDIEQSSAVLSHYVSENLSNLGLLRDEESLALYMAKISNCSYYIANCTSASLSIFVRLAPEFTNHVEGIIWKRENNDFVQDTLADFPIYDSNFDNSWYYKARKNGKGIWTQPYYNDDIKEYVVSYAVPVYKDGVFFAVVGMDIDFDTIAALVNSITVYDSGYAFLTDDDFAIAYHRRIPAGTKILDHTKDFRPFSDDNSKKEIYEYTYKDPNPNYSNKGSRFRMIYKQLSNGMRLVVSVPVKEIDRARNKLIITIICSMILISLFLALLNIIVSNKLTLPIKELSDSTHKIIAGNYDLTFKHHTNDEIGDLMTTFNLMAKSLQIQFDYISSLAYHDSMTGTKNKRAFIDARNDINNKILQNNDNSLKFAIIVFDVNNLKNMNDKFGHKVGDILIKSAANLIMRNFVHSEIFRIGGDEFVTILTDKDYENRNELMTKLRIEMDSPVPEKNEAFEKISIASGLAIFDSSTDKNFQDVFERADEDMYKTKSQMKGGSQNIR